ncbi:MAG: hypothetical protein M1118_16015 [Chloroflexi bacterium]|nr:hypothetical protein [Chloroflexota bacterium]
MTSIRTMHDIRTVRSVATRALPNSDGAVFLQLHRLVSEKQRLEREIELWRRKRERVEQRICEIEQQMEHLHALWPGVASPDRLAPMGGARKAWHSVTLEY